MKKDVFCGKIGRTHIYLAEYADGETMKIIKNIWEYIRSFSVWFCLAVLVGAVSGVVGALFHKAIDFAGETRNGFPWIIYFLPVAGLIITAMYRISKEKLTTNSVLDCIRSKKATSPLLVPFIFVGAFISHLFGASVGREGAALQIGGGIGSLFGKALKLKKESVGTIIMCGMSGAFSAIFTTPVTAAIFALEVVSVGHFKYFRFLPCMISSSVAFMVTKLMGNHVLYYDTVSIPDIRVHYILKVVAISILVSLLSVVFCVLLKKSEHLFEKYIKNPYLIAFVGGLIIVVLTVIVGNNDYNGAGMDIIENALAGKVFAAAFLLKLIFTAVSVGAGFKGGEIVPAFFVGACFGATVAPILGIDPSFAAAIGLICMFCGISNCPIASLVMGIELFGEAGIVYFAISCSVCFVMSGKFGLYSSQKLVYSKNSVSQVDEYSV